nr:MAG TPA: hypothetical protein [Caudoviricetes sp.]
MNGVNSLFKTDRISQGETSIFSGLLKYSYYYW